MVASNLVVALERLPHGSGLPLPAYETGGAAGMDLRAAVQEPHVLEPGARWLCPTGLAIAIPPGYEGQVRPRSGWALKHGVTCLNSPGTIDSDYRGELRVILANLGGGPITVERGARIAQIVFSPVAQASFLVQETLDATARGTGGFGHTGH